MALDFGNKTENGGIPPQGVLTATEFNQLVAQVNKNEEDIGAIEEPNSIESVEATESQESGGNNVVTITETNGTETSFNVKNGTDGANGVSLGDVEIADNLTTDDATKVLSAKQGKVLKDLIDSQTFPIVNDLTTGGTTSALSAEMGKVLNIQLNGGTYTYNSDTDPSLASLPHIYQGYQLKVPTAGTPLEDVEKFSFSSYRNARVPLDNVGQIVYNHNFYSTQGYGCMFVDENDIVISGYVRSNSSTPIETTLDVPSGAKYFIYSYNSHPSASAASITLYVNAIQITTEKIADKAVTAEKLADDAVAKRLIGSVERFYSYNRHNLETDVSGALVQSTGLVEPASSMLTSDFIPVSTKGLYIYGTGGAYGGTMGGYVVYDANKQRLRGSNASSNMIYTYTEGDAFIRFSHRANYTSGMLFGVFELDADGSTPDFTGAVYINFPYQEQVVKNSVVTEKISKECVPELLPAYSMSGGNIMSTTADSLAANTILQLKNFPNYIKNNYVISGKAYIGSGDFVEGSYIRFGIYGGKPAVVKIDTTQAVVGVISNNEWITRKTFTHNLDVASSPFVSFELSLNWNGGSFRITTADGCFIQSWLFTEESYVDYERYGKPFVDSSIALSDVKLSATSPMFRNPIWVLGDSYTSMYSTLWTYQLVHTYGIDDFMLDGVAGGTSAQLYTELQKMLNFGTPRYLVWCLGMNDNPYWRWARTSRLVEMLCRINGIELIYATIPYPTGGSKKDINDYIKASGYRYIDVYKAVSSDDNGTWYAGMNNDGTHPTAIGAKAIAAQVLVDFPEIAG